MSIGRFNRNKMQTTSAISLLFDYGIDIENRRIYVVDNITDTEWEAVAKAIHYFNLDPDKIHNPIEIIVCSDGGSVELMFAFYDTFRTSVSPIHTIITGCCASAAVLVASCAHKRYATENAYLMHHSSKAYGDDLSEKEMEARAGVTKEMAERTYRLLALHSNKTEAWWRKGAQEGGEVWMTAQDMLEAGVIDGIIKNPPYKKPVRKRVKKTNGKQTAKQKSEGTSLTKACKK